MEITNDKTYTFGNSSTNVGVNVRANVQVPNVVFCDTQTTPGTWEKKATMEYDSTTGAIKISF